MWISQVVLRNFRRIKQAEPQTYRFKEGVNLLVGENNIGKTTLVEAIVLCLSIGKNEKNLFWSEEDFNDKNYPIQIQLQFSGLNEPQKAQFHKALVNIEDPDPSKWSLIITFIIVLENGRIRPTLSLGIDDEQKANAFDLLREIFIAYLPALRDVEVDFQTGKRNKISRLLRKDFDEPQKSQILGIFRGANESAMEVSGVDNPMVAFKTKINEYLTSLTIKGHDSNILLDFVDHEFEKILENVAVYLATNKIPIGANGLGYNNLIYIAILLSKFKEEMSKNDHQFHCLIIEEPEAHLHPQLQTLLVDFLQREYGGVQIILTSHSPTIAAVLNLDNLSIFRNDEGGINNVLLKETSITNLSKSLLKRYLDVTKSQLFFARRIIFVEGISEALLIRRLWDLHFQSSPEDQFNRQGVEIVNIGGVSFTPYVELFRHVFADSQVRAVVITDDDRGTGRTCPSEYRFLVDDKLKELDVLEGIFNSAPVSPRFSNLKAAVDSLNVVNLAIFEASKTLEVELGMANPQKVSDMLSLAGINMSLSENASPLLAGLTLWNELDSLGKKADFYANLIESQIVDQLVLPPYIVLAINFLNGTTDPSTETDT